MAKRLHVLTSQGEIWLDQATLLEVLVGDDGGAAVMEKLQEFHEAHKAKLEQKKIDDDKREAQAEEGVYSCGSFAVNGSDPIIVSDAEVTSTCKIKFFLSSTLGKPGHVVEESRDDEAKTFSVKSDEGDASTYDYVLSDPERAAREKKEAEDAAKATADAETKRLEAEYADTKQKAEDVAKAEQDALDAEKAKDQKKVEEDAKVQSDADAKAARVETGITAEPQI